LLLANSARTSRPEKLTFSRFQRGDAVLWRSSGATVCLGSRRKGLGGMAYWWLGFVRAQQGKVLSVCCPPSQERCTEGDLRSTNPTC
jgi:hypothetical protein